MEGKGEVEGNSRVGETARGGQGRKWQKGQRNVSGKGGSETTEGGEDGGRTGTFRVAQTC